MSDQSKIIDPASTAPPSCQHLTIHRSRVEYNSGRKEEWFCDQCGAEFRLGVNTAAVSIQSLDARVRALEHKVGGR